MCLIILKPEASATIKPEEMKASIKRNSDGCGAMWVENDRVNVKKILGTPDNLDEMEKWCQDLFDAHDQILIHHRFTTHGDNIEDNLHPYCIFDLDQGDDMDLYMMHNGMISGTDAKNTRDGFSDTYHYVNDFLKPMLSVNPELLHVEAFQKHLGDFIGASKLTFLDNYGNTVVINREKGEDRKEGCWLSNTYSITPPAVYSKPYTGNYNYVKSTVKGKSGNEVTVYTPPKHNSNVLPLNDTGDSVKKKTAATVSGQASGGTKTPSTRSSSVQEYVGGASNAAVAYSYSDPSYDISNDYESDQQWEREVLDCLSDYDDVLIYNTGNTEDIIEHIMLNGVTRDDVSSMVANTPDYILTDIFEDVLDRLFDKQYQ